MTEDVIERYGTFNTKGCPEDLIFGDFNDQPIPSIYSDLTNDYGDNLTQIDAALTDNEGVEDAVVPNDENKYEDSLASDIDLPPKNILEIEGVDRMGNETKKREIEGVDSETEGVDSDNEGVDNKVLTPERKCYILRNTLNGNYSDKRATWPSMGWNNLIVGSNEIHSVAKAYVNVVNAITSFVKPTPSTNIITNETILTQYIIEQGLKVFGKKGKAAVRKELQQFCDRRVVEPKKPQDLSYEQRRRSLAYPMFLKLKSDEVTIKDRGCADERKQRDWLSKEDMSSPTVSNEGLMLSCMIDVMEGREEATTDIPGAFLHTDYEKVDIHIKLEGAMVTLLEDIDPEY